MNCAPSVTMWGGRTTATRPAKPSHELWKPHSYQSRASEFLQQQNAAALFLDPGLGKTSIVLDAFMRLKDAGMAKRMLVVAPLRVCQTVWRQEGQRWTQFRDLRFSLVHGPKKAERLRDDADVWLINPEGVKGLCDRYPGLSLPFDTVVIDELTKFKNHGAERHKALRPRLKKVVRRWGLTGTPAPNGYMDLFGQMLLLDDGAALGRYITHFRDQFFQVGFDGFTYDLMPGGAKRIEERIKPYVLRMSAEDYLELPPLVDDVRVLDIEPKARATYAAMKKQMLAELPEGTVTGANAAAVYSKLKQMANGAVYVNDAHDVAQIHNTKLEALDELVEELAGQQLLIAYEFNHDVARLKEHFGDRIKVLAGGSSGQTEQIVADWNRGAIPALACHPASAAHGLNLQHSGCAHIAWFSPIWDLELYQQFIRRVLRQGNDAQRIVNHIFVARDSIDELALQALRDKDTTQSRLLRSLTNEILRDAETPAGGVPEIKETNMGTPAKLSRQSDEQTTPAATGRIIPKGWGKVGAAAAAGEEANPHATQQLGDQRARIQEKLRGEPEEQTTPTPAERAKSAFSRGVQETRAALEQTETNVHAADQGKPTAATTTPFMPEQTDLEEFTGAAAQPEQAQGGGEATAEGKDTGGRKRRSSVSLEAVLTRENKLELLRILGTVEAAKEAAEWLAAA